MTPFSTERLLLRRAEETDAAFFLALLNSPGWLTYIGDRDVHTEAQAADYIRNRIMPVYQTPGQGSYIAEVRETGAPVGFVGEASRAILARREVRALPELLAITQPDNERSRRLLEKLGFVGGSGTASVEGSELLLYRRS